MDSLEVSTSEPRHESISLTAWGTAYQRTLTDIPYSQEIFAILDAIIRQSRSPEELELWKFPQLTPMFEARFKIINLLMQQNRINQVIEVAAGFSPRGISMTENPNVTYVEMDLPDVARQKRALIAKMMEQTTMMQRPNLHIVEGSALDASALSKAARILTDKPIAIVNEGLLRYCTHDEKEVIAKNIYELLSGTGGVWITPDVTARGMNATGPLKQVVREQNQRLMELTGIDVRQNYFRDEATARAFFESLGFTIERHSFAEVAHALVSPQQEGLSPDQVADSIGNSAAYVMRAI